MEDTYTIRHATAGRHAAASSPRITSPLAAMTPISRLALIAVGLLAAHNALAACAPRGDDELKAMSNDDLKAAYCDARAQSVIQVPTPMPSLPSLPGSPNTRPRVAAPAGNTCLTATAQLVRVMETRKIDIDQARASCGK